MEKCYSPRLLEKCRAANEEAADHCVARTYILGKRKADAAVDKAGPRGFPSMSLRHCETSGSIARHNVPRTCTSPVLSLDTHYNGGSIFRAPHRSAFFLLFSSHCPAHDAINAPPRAGKSVANAALQTVCSPLLLPLMPNATTTAGYCRRFLCLGLALLLTPLVLLAPDR